MAAHRRAGAALCNAGRYADAESVWRAGYREHEDAVCSGLADLAALFAEETSGERGPPTITDDGAPIDVSHLDPATLAVASRILATQRGQDASVLTAAAEAAAEESGERYRALLVAYVEGGTAAQVAFQRLSALLDRRRRRADDVAGLFDPADEE
jgi:hypothetical protein